MRLYSQINRLLLKIFSPKSKIDKGGLLSFNFSNNLKFPRTHSIFLLILIFVVISSLWQNCSQVKLEKMEESSHLKAQGIEQSFLKVPTTSKEDFRAAIIIDMSNSMFSGPCPDSIDVSLNNLTPSVNCLGPTGVDPEGKRFRMVLKWIDDIEIKASEGKINSEKIKFMILPFSNLSINQYWSLENSYFGSTKIVRESIINKIIKALALEKEIFPGFINVGSAKKHIYILWMMYSYIHGAPIDRKIPSDIVSAVKNNWSIKGNTNASSGTSIILPALEKLNLELYSELTRLQEKNNLDKSHFEVVFMSDGVPKPHALHIEQTMKYVWQVKKEVCDRSLYPANHNCASISSSEYGWANVNATSCFSKCSNYVKNYIDTGTAGIPDIEKPVCTGYYSIPYACHTYSDGSTSGNRWTKNQIKCGQCFEVLYQFSYLKGSACQSSSCRYSFGQDGFKNKITEYWGDWTLNRHAEIIGKIKASINIFKTQFPSSYLKLSFMRIDSEKPEYSTQAGELVPELNWIEKSKEYFINTHKFFVIKSLDETPVLFSDIQDNNKYNISQVYLYLKNARSQINGNYSADSDGDGIEDRLEAGSALTDRTNGSCLDSIKKKYSECITVGCNTAIDMDKDGLNQCEEKTIGTDDFSPDSDGDFIIDIAEILYGLNPTQDDRKVRFNTDGFTNFEHFIKGFPPKVNLRSVKDENQIKIKTELIDTKVVVDEKGNTATIPSYQIQVENVPYVDLINERSNQVIVILKIDNFSNPDDSIWYSKTFETTKLNREIKINLGDFDKLNLGSP